MKIQSRPGMKQEMMKIPRTRSKNPVTILRTVAKAILEEPKRYNQRVWLATDSYDSALAFPACGTVACIAGWTCLVTGANPDAYDVPQVAAKILGLADSPSLFVAAIPGTAGTKAHACAGVRHIARFVKDTWNQTLGITVGTNLGDMETF
jgi:hypothetical protein